jgi:hypothetical protein
MSDFLNNAKNSIANATESIKQNLPDPNAVASSLSERANSVREATNNATADFSSQGVMNASKEFLNSNSTIARFVFIILILIIFMVLLNIGVAFVSYLATPSKSPYIIHGMLPGSGYTIFPQDPASSKAVVYRSNNRTGGVEFTWALWLKIDNLPADTKYHPIFVKGTDSYNESGSEGEIGVSRVNNGPGLYLSKGESIDSCGNQLKLTYIMDIVSPDKNGQLNPLTKVIENIPIGKWFHVAVRMQGKVLDCYINGVIVQRMSFGDAIPKQNYDPIVYAGNGGFAGSISNLRYYDYALSVFEINSVVYYGPNLKAANGSSNNYFDYLGQSWYSNSIPNQ